MNAQQFEEKYINRYFHQERLSEAYDYLGKFGQATFYQFVMRSQGAVISVDVCTEHGQITGLVPEKTLVEDEYGYMDENATEEMQDFEYDLIGQQLDPVLISKEEAQRMRQRRMGSPMSQPMMGGMNEAMGLDSGGFGMNEETGLGGGASGNVFSDPWGMSYSEGDW